MHQHAVYFRVVIGAAVFDDCQIVVHVGRPANGGEDNATGGDAHEDERGDALRA